MSGTVEQNATQVATTIEAAASSATSMLQLQAKAYSQTSVGSAHATGGDWALLTGIIIPQQSGYYVFSARNNTGSISYTCWFIIHVLNTQMHTSGIWETARGQIAHLYFLPESGSYTSTAYQYWNPTDLALNQNFIAFVNGISNPTTFTATLSRIG